MSNVPPPSRLTTIAGLATLDPGQKVRFLGCVKRYEVETGCIILQDWSADLISVDLNVVLEGLNQNNIAKGNWLNVIGYTSMKAVSAKLDPRTKPDQSMVHVQATMVWSAGDIDVSRYREVVARRLDGNSPA